MATKRDIDSEVNVDVSKLSPLFEKTLKHRFHVYDSQSYQTGPTM